MFRIVLILLSVLSLSIVSAQERLTPAYFPTPGDTLQTFQADTDWAASLDLQLAGGSNLDWDFSDPVSAGRLFDLVEAADNPNFPSATTVITNSLLNSNYYRVEGGTFVQVGAATRLELLPSFTLEAPISPALADRRTGDLRGLSFATVFDNVTTFSPDSLPPEALALLPAAAIGGVDSFRVTVTIARDDEYDADGTVRLGDNFYSAIREKRSQTAFIKVDVLTSFGSFDLVLLLGDDPQGLGEFLGQQDTVVTYTWWNNDSKEPIAEAQTDPEGNLVSMRYKRALESTSTGGPNLKQARVNIYPNPASAYFNYTIDGIPSGAYHLGVVNLLGREVVARDFKTTGSQAQLNVTTSQLPAGTYIIHLRNERGLIVSSRKLLVR